MKWLKDILKRNFRRTSILRLLMSLALISGCSKPYIYPTPSEEVRASLGTIGVVSSHSLPDFKYDEPSPEGKIAGTFKGAGKGALAPIVALCQRGRDYEPFCTIGIALAPVAAIVGGIHGAVTAVPVSEEDVEDINGVRESLNVAFDRLRIQQEMRDGFIAITKEKTNRRIVDVNEMIEEGELIKSNKLKDAGFDSVIIYDTALIRLSAVQNAKNSLRYLHVGAKVRILSSGDTQLYITDFVCEGEMHTFKTWAVNNGSLFKEALERCYNDIANQAVERLFILKTKGASEVSF